MSWPNIEMEWRRAESFLVRSLTSIFAGYSTRKNRLNTVFPIGDRLSKTIRCEE